MSEENTFTFYPEFQEFLTLYRGLENIWIADGTADRPGSEGVLYGQFVNGTVQELGSPLSYDDAKKIYNEQGKPLTYKTWLNILLSTSTNAVRAETASDSAALNAETLQNRIDLLENETTATITYCNSTSSTVIPSGPWGDAPVPEPGYFTWTKVVLSWPGLSSFTFYLVTGYKEAIASAEEIEEQFPGHSEHDEYASADDINNLFE